VPVYLPGLTLGGLGYGGASYGYSPYGSGVHPRLPVPTTGGYGGASYGLASYGSVDITPPRVTGAVSLDGYRVEVFFSEDMAGDSALVDPANYSFSDVYGVPVSTVQVQLGMSSGLGFSSVIVVHSGTTLGGQYLVEVTGPTDIAGNPVGPPPTNSTSFYSLGDQASALVSIPPPPEDDGRTVRVDFKNSLGDSQAMLTEAEFSPGVESTSSYGTETSYPVAPTIGSATQNPTLLSQVDLDVHPMTSATYDLTLGPSLSMDYEGGLLPDDDPNFAGTEIGTGSSSLGTSVLVLSKGPAVQYGWSFGDTTGRMVAGTSYRLDFEFSTSGTTITPAVTNSTLGVLSASDGVIQIDVGLASQLGTEVLEITSGAFSAQVPAVWNDSNTHTVSVIRNQKGDFYSVLFDGVPLSTFSIASATGAAVYAAGSAFVLGTAHEVSLFKLNRVKLTSSSTLFTSAWNFIHGLEESFTGSSVLTRDRILTKYGPLVRGWGDNTPATKQDVEVRVDGVAVSLAGVNPYVGEVYPEIPIPLAAAGTLSVEVDYIWFRTPAMEMAGLNTRGLTLNTWDRSSGHTSPPEPGPTPISATGTVKTNRFSLGVALAPYARKSPEQIGHKYIGYQKEYSALLNTESTLKLNQNPHAISVGDITVEALVESGVFDGTTTPAAAPTPWDFDGEDDGSVVGDGTYKVVDSSTGPYGIGTAAIYHRELDLSLETFANITSRFLVGSYVLDGVFTGVGFGIHDGANLIMVGALVVDGVKHVGILLDGSNPHLEESWQVGPASDAEAKSSTEILIPFGEAPVGLYPGQKFRVPSGPQKGVYTIGECGLDTESDSVGNTFVEITFSPALPYSIDLYEGRDFPVVFEVPWDTNLVSFRLNSEFPEGGMTIRLGGVLSAVLADTSVEYPATLPAPVETSLLIPASDKGEVFWGSISRRAESESLWDFVQYESSPTIIHQTVQGVQVTNNTDAVLTDPWYEVGGLGEAKVDPNTGTKLLVRSTSASPPSQNVPTEFCYERVEPFLAIRKSSLDANFEFQVTTGVEGVGNASFRALDTRKKSLLTTILYVDTPSSSGAIKRRVITGRPKVSLSGLQSPTDAGYTRSAFSTASDPFVRGQVLEFTKSTSQVAEWTLSSTGDSLVEDEGMVLECRLAIGTGTTVGDTGIGFVIGGNVAISTTESRTVQLSFSGGGKDTIDLLDANEAVVVSFAFPGTTWEDGAFHSYKLSCDPVADIVVLSIDDVVIGNEPLSSFSGGTGAVSHTIENQISTVGTGEFSEVVLDSVYAIPLRVKATGTDTIGRTLGFLAHRNKRTGAPSYTELEDIDSYVVPRSDLAPHSLNSSAAATIVQMDYTASSVNARVFLDPGWGVSLYRPDLPLPPTSPGTPGITPANSTDPRDAWCTLEYAEMPLDTRSGGNTARQRGVITLGTGIEEFAGKKIGTTLWGPTPISYRVREFPHAGYGLAPQNMVLNRHTTLTSGEYNIDSVPETREIVSRSAVLVVITDSVGAYKADRIFVVVVDGGVVPAADYTFDKITQELRFVSTAALPTSHHKVAVTFAIGKPVTKQYLCDQEIEETVTVLNTGTPVLVQSADYADDKYASVEICTNSSGGDEDVPAFAPACDVAGLTDIEIPVTINSSFTTETVHAASTQLQGTGIVGTGTSLVSGTAGLFTANALPYARQQQSTLNSLVYTTAHNIPFTNAAAPQRAQQQMSAHSQGVAIILEDRSPREEDASSLFSGGEGDNTPPSMVDVPTINAAYENVPSGTPTTNGNGAAAYALEDFATTGTVSVAGPALFYTGRTTIQGGNQLPASSTAQQYLVLSGGSAINKTPTITTGIVRAAN